MTNSLTTDGFHQYDEHLGDLHLSYIIEYSPHQQDQEKFFLPHQGVYCNGKLRMVFHGSAKDSTGRSLISNPLSCLLSMILNQVGCQSDIKACSTKYESRKKYV
ncbi:hypothetical protein E2C01_012897 [Portunus trituberculatus]|uniref:Uncharacterized protein n=1 Tax=Portunus trituberculatus TaxID=210409 RepID=A0A5B7DF86_PORTR|nr:hypothetical protein [Portunus trituberculatus]